MLRRVPAAFLLLALLFRGAASLHACEAARDAAAPGQALAHPAHASGAHDGHARTCDRRHAGRCPHAAGAALHPCASDPVTGLTAAHDAAPPAGREAVPVDPAVVQDAVAPPEPDGASAPVPEAPPPRPLA
jgi:hypothetical protein